MKTLMGIAILLALPLAVNAAAGIELNQEQEMYKHNFSATVDLSQGALQCRDKMPDHGFGALPGAISLQNHGGRFGLDRVREDNGSAARVDYFFYQLADSETCARLMPKLSNTFMRDVISERRVVGIINSLGSRAGMDIKEVIRIPLGEGVVLEGQATWRDFRADVRAIDLGRRMVDQLLARMDDHADIKIKLTRHRNELKCVEDRFVVSPKNRMVLTIAGASNVKEVSRVFSSDQDCQDTLSEILARLELIDPNSQGIDAELSRDLSIEGGGGWQTRRGELVSVTYMGLRFSGSEALPLW